MDDLMIAAKSKRRPIDDDTISDSGILDNDCELCIRYFMFLWLFRWILFNIDLF